MTMQTRPRTIPAPAAPREPSAAMRNALALSCDEIARRLRDELLWAEAGRRLRALFRAERERRQSL